ncbi:GNAT family N-acetyltransferase [Dactylosporangium aurantiacum]|uniref:GNAT family N-acetyltransferase n=1 Tax=Dactylosporangium aurantiacum TaxID=35754 RepID=A0A9Q9IEA3_9ACTN|nr:GNAT family N-acetyltransferase [Dactylosporangium aurantiacum]MDG6108233.1 GNAT family N-acetyltransferase [Dactylosporangium aurantiacum]UWZ53781.1 GNAT family N-acetyltransferase [Dactylosporangium aurantiacum]
MTGYTLRAATTADIDAFSRVIRGAFFVTAEPDPSDSIRTVLDPARYTLAELDGQIVGTAGIFTRDLAVPGAVIPAAHVTGVSVAATHTRKGLLRRMMTSQLSTAPEAIAVLWASEGRIYQRFGYGLATQNVTVRADRRELTVRGDAGVGTGTLRAAVPAEVRKELSQVYDRVLPDQPGWSSRDDAWWAHLTHDPEDRREGFTATRAVLYENADGVVDGYTRYRVRNEWDDNGPKGEVNVVELVAATPDAAAALWRFLLGVDLTRTVVKGLSSPDEPLFHLVEEPRRLGGKIGDGLWVRIVDLPRALTARRYAAPVDVVLEVTDTLLPANAGRWRLRVGAGGALVNCAPTAAPADLTCDVTDLGAAYLGGTKLGALAATGRVQEHRPGAVAAASTAFGWHVTPTSIEIF